MQAASTVTIKFSSNYVPYGQNYAISGKEVFMYTGKPLDSATGLYYYGARYYDDGIGRFVTEDSYTGDFNDPLSLNLYIYARDNPERYRPEWCPVAAGGGVIDNLLVSSFLHP